LAGKNKYYVVWKGAKPGIYSTWEECKLQTHGYKNPIFKSFGSLSEAETAYSDDYKKYTNSISKETDKAPSGSRPEKNQRMANAGIVNNSVAVDAACAGNPGLMEYQCVETISKKLIFHRGPFQDGTNNIGEFLGLVHILALLDKHGKYDVTVYTDSLIAMKWVKNKKAKTKMVKNNKNAILFEMIEKAEQWLSSHTVKNPVLKWETEIWGEIPADFGRK